MDKIASFTDNDRRQLFTETSAKTGLPAGVVEKDFWVCWILWKLFTCPDVSRHIIFKGGTSLSKVYGLIERFSEDIDLILDWREITEEDPLEQRSKTKQDTFNKALLEESEKYLAEEFYPRINVLLDPICRSEPVEDDPHALKITFPTLFSSPYLRPEILLETGPLAA